MEKAGERAKRCQRVYSIIYVALATMLEPKICDKIDYLQKRNARNLASTTIWDLFNFLVIRLILSDSNYLFIYS